MVMVKTRDPWDDGQVVGKAKVLLVGRVLPIQYVLACHSLEDGATAPCFR